MSIFLLALSLLGSPYAQARVDTKFLGVVGIMAISDRVNGSVTDDDPQRLLAAMNVEEREEGGYRAKTIKAADKKFTLLCSDRGGGAVVCTIVIKQGNQGTVNPGLGLIRFVAMGNEAAQLNKLFFSDPATKRYEYLSVDKSVHIASDEFTFVAEYIKR